MLKRLRWSKLEDVKWQKHTHNWKKNMNGKTTTQTVMIQSAPSLPVDTAPAFKMCTKRFLSRFIFTIVIVVISWSFHLTQTTVLDYLTLANSNSQSAVMPTAAGPLDCVFYSFHCELIHPPRCTFALPHDMRNVCCSNCRFRGWCEKLQ